MPTRRRSILAALASIPAILGGCVGSPEEPPRTVVTQGDNTPRDLPENPIEPVKPTIVSQDYARGEDGNVVVEATLRNRQPAPSTGTLFARIRYEGTVQRFQSAFTVGSFGESTVTITAPIDYEVFAEEPNLRLSIALKQSSAPTDVPTDDSTPAA